MEGLEGQCASESVKNECERGFVDQGGRCIEEKDLDAICQRAKISAIGLVQNNLEAREGLVGLGESAVPLNIQVNVNDSGYKIRSLPLRDKKEVNVTDGGATIQMTDTGDFSIELLSGERSCQLLTLTANCKPGNDPKGTRCVPKPEKTSSNLQYILGGLIGTLLAGCVVLPTTFSISCKICGKGEGFLWPGSLSVHGSPQS